MPDTKSPQKTSIGFTGEVEQIGDRFIIRLPEEASTQLPSRGQVAAHVDLDGQRFGTVVEPDGRRGHWIAIDEKMRKALSLKDVGDGADIAVGIEPHKSWPEPEVPDDLQAALDDANDLAELWQDITPMARWEWVRWVGATKNPQTRERRVEVSISKLRDGKRRPCCFDLSSCTDPELAKSGKLVETA